MLKAAQGTGFRWVKASTSAERTQFSQIIARHLGRFLERQGLLERDSENRYLAGDVLEAALVPKPRVNLIPFH